MVGEAVYEAFGDGDGRSWPRSETSGSLSAYLLPSELVVRGGTPILQ